LLQEVLVRCCHGLAQQPSKISSELVGTEPLVEGADNLDTNLYISRGLELAEAIVAGRDDLGQVLVQTKRLDLL
jgi:hypothetical protein